MNSINSNNLRLAFAKELSDMYQTEVPLYAELLSIVSEVNQQANINLCPLPNSMQERHGAIRLGKASELFNMRRLFALMNMHPVAYYDLSSAGLPVHSTAFRPLQTSDLEINPFRLFTSLLRLDLITDKNLRENAQKVLDNRSIFSDELLELISLGESLESFSEHQQNRFMQLTIDIFKWHCNAEVEHSLYNELKTSHPLIADIVSFKGPHINHLTPATLDIDAVQTKMQQKGIKTKVVIEGPPRRSCPILLRQTSFTAIAEPVTFTDVNEKIIDLHTARFGEIEQRGIALTQKGQHLYDELIQQGNKKSPQYNKELKKIFSRFPDSYFELRKEGLAFFIYEINNLYPNQLPEKTSQNTTTIEDLVTEGAVTYKPILYEDFLPVSAAGIFQSNLDHSNSNNLAQQGNQDLFEEHMGCSVIDPFDLYAQQENLSIKNCLTYFKE